MSNYDRGVKHPKLKSCKVLIPAFLVPGTSFVEDNFPQTGGGVMVLG